MPTNTSDNVPRLKSVARAALHPRCYSCSRCGDFVVRVSRAPQRSRRWISPVLMDYDENGSAEVAARNFDDAGPERLNSRTARRSAAEMVTPPHPIQILLAAEDLVRL